ncbi:MAG: hypothetical protein ACM3US_02445 [Sphingomonadaceae bacterium]
MPRDDSTTSRPCAAQHPTDRLKRRPQFREKPDWKHDELARKLDVAELMSRPAVVPIRASFSRPELDPWPTYWGHNARRGRTLSSAESVGDAWATKQHIVPSARPAPPTSRVPITGVMVPKDLSDITHLMAKVFRHEAGVADLQRWYKLLAEIPHLREMWEKLDKEQQPPRPGRDGTTTAGRPQPEGSSRSSPKELRAAALGAMLGLMTDETYQTWRVLLTQNPELRRCLLESFDI